MSDKFLHTGGSGEVNISNGTANIFAASLSSVNLEPSKALKTNSVRQLVSTNLQISDVQNLQTELNNNISTPYNGTIEATDFKTSTETSVNGELQKINNFTASTANNTNITGILNVTSDIKINNTSVITSKGLELGGNNVIYSKDTTDLLQIGTSANSVILGFDAGEYPQHVDNIAIGNLALRGVNGVSTLCYDNVAIGTNSMMNARTLNDNVAVGAVAGQNLSTENRNTIVGAYGNCTSGNENCIVLGYHGLSDASNQCVIGGYFANTSITQIVPGIDNNTDIGRTDRKFKDSYFSGTVNCNNLISNNATINGRTPIYGGLSHHISQKSVAVGENALPNVSGQNNACFGYRAGSEMSGSNCWRTTIMGSRNDTVHSSEAFPTSGNNNLTLLGYHVSLDSTQNAISPIEYSVGIGSRCIIRESQSCTIGGWFGSFQILRIVPGTNNMCDLGSTTYQYKNIHLTGHINQLLKIDDSNNRCVPDADGTRDLGSGSLRFNDIYSVNSPIHSSDFNLKTDIISTPLGLNFINKLNPVQYRFIDGKRPHQGLIAQDVKMAMDELKINDFAGYITGYQKTKVDILDEKTKEKIGEKDEINDTPYFALRYTEFIAPLIKAVQELSARVKELEGKISV